MTLLIIIISRQTGKQQQQLPSLSSVDGSPCLPTKGQYRETSGGGGDGRTNHKLGVRDEVRQQAASSCGDWRTIQQLGLRKPTNHKQLGMPRREAPRWGSNRGSLSTAPPRKPGFPIPSLLFQAPTVRWCSWYLNATLTHCAVTLLIIIISRAGCKQLPLTTTTKWHLVFSFLQKNF